MTSSAGTITGGYIKAGKMVVVSSRVITAVEHPAGTVIASGISPSLFEISGLMCKDGSTGANIDVYIYNGNVVAKNLLPAGTYIITGGYISAA